MEKLQQQQHQQLQQVPGAIAYFEEPYTSNDLAVILSFMAHLTWIG